MIEPMQNGGDGRNILKIQRGTNKLSGDDFPTNGLKERITGSSDDLKN